MNSPPPAIDPNALFHAETNFGLRILSDVGTTQPSVFSPLSILLSLSLVHLGARGHTKNQLKDAIFNGSTHEQFVDHFTHVVKLIDNDVNNVQTSIANRLFYGNDQTVEQDYLQNIGKHYKAYAEKVNFGNTKEAADVINKFINESTKGKIDEMVKPNNLNGVDGMLVNAIYFEADWRHKFQRNSAKDGTFHYSATNKRTEKFLSDSSENRKYSSDEFFEAVFLEYKDKSTYFAIFLPKRRFGLNNALKKMDAKRFHALLDKKVYENVFITIPKFKIEKNINLNNAFTGLGLRELFTERADLNGIGPGFKISSAAHEAMIEVDEWGTRAAAATEVKIFMISAKEGVPIQFKADQPFLFAIIKDNIPLFMGVYA